MAVLFNADEILAMAEQIERNGAAFYRRAAEITRDPQLKERLEQLTQWELSHERLFAGLRAGLSEREKAPPSYDPNGDAALYLREMAGQHVFRANRDAATLLQGSETPREILDLAIGFERDTILFFESLTPFVPPSMGADKIQRLIQEEVGHVAYLAREKERVGG